MKYSFFLLVLLPFFLLFGIDQSELSQESLESLFDYYKSNPIEINTASENEIYSLPYVSEITAFKIYDYIKQNGEITNLNILVTESIISSDIATVLAKIIVFKHDTVSPSSISYQFRNKRILEKAEGYLDSNYLGNRSYFLNKFKFSSEHIKLNFLTEKEAGEIAYTDNFKFSAEYKDKDSKIILGNYNFFSATKLLQYETMFIDPYSVTQSFKFYNYARSNLSSMDYYGFNGIFASRNFSNFNISAFYGEKPISVVLSDDKIYSVNLNAYTRTENEIERYHNESHFLKGGAIQFVSKNFSSSLTISDERYSKDLTSDSKLHEGILGELQLRRKFGDSFLLEFNDAMDLSNNNFVINSYYYSKKVKLNLYLSRIEKDKLSLSSQGIMEGDGESENLLGFKMRGKVYGKTNFILSINFFSSEYEIGYLPGGEVKAEFDTRNKAVSFNCQFKYKSYEFYDDDIYSTKDKIDSRFKFQVKLNKWKVSSYLKYSDWYDDGYGYLFSQSFIMNLRKGLSVRLGADLYFTEGSTIMYAGLYDIGLYPGLISYSGVGKSVYAFVSYGIGNFIFTLGISEDSTEDSETIGSGYDEIDSNSFHRVEFNVKYLSDFMNY